VRWRGHSAPHRYCHVDTSCHCQDTGARTGTAWGWGTGSVLLRAWVLSAQPRASCGRGVAVGTGVVHLHAVGVVRVRGAMSAPRRAFRQQSRTRRDFRFGRVDQRTVGRDHVVTSERKSVKERGFRLADACRRCSAGPAPKFSKTRKDGKNTTLVNAPACRGLRLIASDCVRLRPIASDSPSDCVRLHLMCGLITAPLHCLVGCTYCYTN
jgi:hypothetical protein